MQGVSAIKSLAICARSKSFAVTSSLTLVPGRVKAFSSVPPPREAVVSSKGNGNLSLIATISETKAIITADEGCHATKRSTSLGNALPYFSTDQVQHTTRAPQTPNHSNRCYAGEIEATAATVKGEMEQSHISGIRITKVRGAGVEVVKPEAESLELERATPRRLDWTPPRRNRPQAIDLTQECSASDDVAATTASFSGVLQSFAYGTADSPRPLGSLTSLHSLESEPRNVVRSQGSRTRPIAKRTGSRKDTASGEKGTKASGAKSSIKRKLQTVTEAALKEFLPIEDLCRKESPLQSFLSTSESKSSSDLTTGDGQKEDLTSDSRQCKKYRSAGRAANPGPLSPEEAIQSAANQDFLFGTSSQLVREDSPSYLSDLQVALKNSEASLKQPLNSLSHSTDGSLWTLSTRSPEGSLLKTKVNSVKSLDAGLRPLYSTSNGAFRSTSTLLVPATRTSRYHGPEANLGVLGNENTTLATNPEAQTEFVYARNLPRSMAEAACRVRPGSRSPVKKVRHTEGRSCLKQKVRSAKIADAGTGGIDYSAWTVPELSKKIKSFGFKAVKGKSAMIELLEQCEASIKGQQPSECEIQPIAEPSMVNQEAGSTRIGTAKPAPKKRGRPPKKNKALNAATSVIPEASEVPQNLVSSVTSAKPAPIKRSSPVAEDDVSVEVDHDQGAMVQTEATDLNASLLDAITAAVRSDPPTHNPYKPTWNEKILMYDPIVLEDLSLWLNTTGLGRVGVDDEVWPTLVRQWCEERSICCLWRENLRGGTRSRY